LYFSYAPALQKIYFTLLWHDIACLSESVVKHLSTNHLNAFKWHQVNVISQQEAQLMLKNSRDAFRCQSRSPNMVPFDMIGMVSY